jgi:hypothetical protein
LGSRHASCQRNAQQRQQEDDPPDGQVAQEIAAIAAEELDGAPGQPGSEQDPYSRQMQQGDEQVVSSGKQNMPLLLASRFLGVGARERFLCLLVSGIRC